MDCKFDFEAKVCNEAKFEYLIGQVLPKEKIWPIRKNGTYSSRMPRKTAAKWQNPWRTFSVLAESRFGMTNELGDSLRRKIDEGLARCNCGVVILSPPFFGKHYPNVLLPELRSGKDLAQVLNGALAISPGNDEPANEEELDPKQARYEQSGA